MDLSKLPRLSQTKPGDAPEPIDPAAPASPPHQPPQPVMHVPGERMAPPAADAASVWICLAVGVILLLMYPTMIKYVSSLLFGTTFLPFKLPDGTVVPYPQVHPQFFSDLAITLFAVVLIVDGIILGWGRRAWMIAAALTLTVLATLVNLAYVGMTMAKYGPPLMSLIAVAFGVYIAIHQANLLKAMRGTRY